MSFPVNSQALLPCGFTNGGQARGTQYPIIQLRFQYQMPGGAYYIGGDLTGTVGQVASRYFQAC